jgi:hypothetical protein
LPFQPSAARVCKPFYICLPEKRIGHNLRAS